MSPRAPPSLLVHSSDPTGFLPLRSVHSLLLSGGVPVSLHSINLTAFLSQDNPEPLQSVFLVLAEEKSIETELADTSVHPSTVSWAGLRLGSLGFRLDVVKACSRCRSSGPVHHTMLCFEQGHPIPSHHDYLSTSIQPYSETSLLPPCLFRSL